MTTIVTVKTHDWPVRISGFAMQGREPAEGAKWEERATVPPHSEQKFVCHAHMDLLVQEMQLPATNGADTADA